MKIFLSILMASVICTHMNDHMHYFPNVCSSLDGVLLSIRMAGAGGQYLVEKIALSVLKNRHQNGRKWR